MLRINNEQVGSGIWFCIGLIIIIASLRYGMGSMKLPGSGFMPFLAGLAICLFSFIGLVHGTLKQKQGVSWTPTIKGLMWQKSLLVVGALLAYAFLMNRLGFIICTVLFLGFLLGTVRRVTWLVTIVWSILITLSAYVIFETWLKSQVPKGPWGF